ncbi:endonuclease domain-containing protein [Parasphingorhabdus marina]
MWLELRAKRFHGIKFRKQKVIGKYIADFSARDPMLVIEIDGDSHGVQREYEERRTRYLEGQGYRVVRFTNEEVMTNLDGVLQRLGEIVCDMNPPLPTLSPEGERAL